MKFEEILANLEDFSGKILKHYIGDSWFDIMHYRLVKIFKHVLNRDTVLINYFCSRSCSKHLKVSKNGVGKPLYKNENKKVFSNFRPITLIYNIAKKYSKLFNTPFQKNISTKNVCIFLTGQIYHCLQKGKKKQ